MNWFKFSVILSFLSALKFLNIFFVVVRNRNSLMNWLMFKLLE